VLQSFEGVCGELLGLIERKRWGQITLPSPLVTGEEMGKNPVSLIFYRRCRRMYALWTLMNLDFFTADVGGCTRYGRWLRYSLFSYFYINMF
jgi:hypothetical protein